MNYIAHMAIGKIQDPGSLLTELEHDRAELLSLGAEAEGRATHVVREREVSWGDYGHWATVWFIGDSVVVRELSVGLGRDGRDWHARFIDIDLSTGDMYAHGQSPRGEGTAAINVFDADYHPGTDGVTLKQLHNLLGEIGTALVLQPDTIHPEPYHPADFVG